MTEQSETIAALRREVEALRARNAELEATLKKAPDADLLERAQRLARRLDKIIASVPGVVWEQGFPDDGSASRFVSDHITNLSGYTHEEVLAMKDFWVAILHPDDREEVTRQFNALVAQGGGVMEARWITKDGRTLWVEGHVRVNRDESGAAVGAYGVSMDVTHRKLAEQERALLQDEAMRAQHAALEQLGTPLIPISAEVMVMPLIGAIDERRAERVITTLLEGISRARARTAILDITGVTSVDAQTADALIRAARAVQLLGAQAILTGMRPEVAQTLVALGADLGGLVTRGTLESGIAFAMRR